MTFWKRIEKIGSRLGIVAGIVVTISGGSLYVGAKKIISGITETLQVKDITDSIRAEMSIHWKASESLHDDISGIKE